jgi:Rieske Fe-S protein
LVGGGVALITCGTACGTNSAAPKVDEVSIAPGEIPVSGADPFHSEPGRFYLLNDGEPLALYARCTHRSCLVQWDEDEGGFHCPCHGSRFDRAGLVLNGPAERPLEHMAVIPQVDGGLVIRTGERSPGGG